MRFSGTSEPGSPGVPNEDWAGAASRAVVVLDGVTLPDAITPACHHGTPWYVRQLGTRLLAAAEGTSSPLTDVLAAAIADVTALHPQCDPASIGAPSAAVAMLRVSEGQAEYLVLADVTVALETREGITVITDDRVSASVAGIGTAGPDIGDRIAGQREAHRNRPGGYWVAAADPTAARHAVTGTLPRAERAIVLTDGAARAASMLGWSWQAVMKMDPAELIRGVREAENLDQERQRWPRFKVSDDATAVSWESKS